MKFIKKEPLNKGWSTDSKYCITSDDGRKYLLRISPAKKSDTRETEFFYQQKVAAIGVPMCEPVESGRCPEGFYIIQTWIDGDDAEKVIPSLSHTDQYRCGIDAGKILKMIHTVSAPPDQPAWSPRFNAKADKKIRLYEDCPVKFDGAREIIDYINANRRLLDGRPQSFQHGDYHIGNMMISGGKLVIIDFDRCDFGDPWEEFNRIVWSAQAAPHFASGIVDGYFDGCVPETFWQLLALYIGCNMLSSVPWAIPFGEKEVNTMLRQAEDVLSWYDRMRDPIPKWYTKK
ncbi:MAG: phosphotransferase [Clostridia bacterium]|nr:phosphotransferase [Clostridia bacterium]